MIAETPTLQPELVFCEEKHEYKWRGEVVPGVTSMLSRCGLVDSSWFSEQAAIRGQAVHAAIHLYNEGRLDWDTLSDEIAPYLCQWIEFCAVHPVEIYYSEIRMASHAHRFGGTADFIGLMDGKPVIMDFKTMLKPRKASEWWAVQLALYAKLAEESLNIFNPHRISLILTPETYRLARPELPDEIADKMADAILILNKLKGR